MSRHSRNKERSDRNCTFSNNAISTHLVNKTMLNAKKRIRGRGRITRLQKVLLDEAIKAHMAKIPQEDLDKPIQKPE